MCLASLVVTAPALSDTIAAPGQAAPQISQVVSQVVSQASPQPAGEKTIGKIEPIVPPTTPQATVMSVECAVPRASLAEVAPLPRLAKRLRKNKKPVVLAVGSSSTWGVGASRRRKTYPAQLENILEKAWTGTNVVVINRGFSGEIASATAERLLILAGEFRPDLVLWQLGTNDAVLRVRVEDFTNTVRSTVKLLRAAGIDVVLVGLQYTPKWARDSHYFAIRDALNAIAKEEKLLYVRRYAAMEFLARTKSNVNMMARDNFHLNDLGYQCMAEHVAQAVIANMFVRQPQATGSKN